MEREIYVTYAENAFWSVTITSADGCPVMATNDNNPNVEGNIGGRLRIYSQDIEPTTCDEEMEPVGSVSIEVEGGIPPYEYTWSGPITWTDSINVTQSQITDLPRGWYNVTVTDSDPVAVQETFGWYWVNCQVQNDDGGGFVRGKKTTSLIAPTLTAFPNPLTTQTHVQFQVPKTQIIQLRLYAVTGQLVTTLMEGRVTSGQVYQIPIEGGALPKGVYLLQLTLESGEMKQYQLVK